MIARATSGHYDEIRRWKNQEIREALLRHGVIRDEQGELGFNDFVEELEIIPLNIEAQIQRLESHLRATGPTDAAVADNRMAADQGYVQAHCDRRYSDACRRGPPWPRVRYRDAEA